MRLWRITPCFIGSQKRRGHRECKEHAPGERGRFLHCKPYAPWEQKQLGKRNMCPQVSSSRPPHHAHQLQRRIKSAILPLETSGAKPMRLWSQLVNGNTHREAACKGHAPLEPQIVGRTKLPLLAGHRWIRTPVVSGAPADRNANRRRSVILLENGRRKRRSGRLSRYTALKIAATPKRNAPRCRTHSQTATGHKTRRWKPVRKSTVQRMRKTARTAPAHRANAAHANRTHGNRRDSLHASAA